MTLHKPKGELNWLIPDAYIPPESSGSLESHESVCVLNCSSEEARLAVTLYFEDQDPWEGIAYTVPARRTIHIRTTTLTKDGTPPPRGVPYAIEVESSIPVIVQYSRLDATQAENALMSVVGYPISNRQA